MIQKQFNKGKYIASFIRFIQLLSSHKYEFSDTFLTRYSEL